MATHSDIVFPRSREQAERYRYGITSQNQAGDPYDPDRCAAEVTSVWHHRQCRRRPGYGPSSMFCRQHGPIVTRLTAEEP